MVVDTSALVAVLEGEPEAQALAEALRCAKLRLISAGTLLEVGIVVLARRGSGGVAILDELIDLLPIEVVPVTVGHVREAREGFARYGKGRHPARLNFGDCFAYALAKATGHPLLFKGQDFALTDVEAVELLSC